MEIKQIRNATIRVLYAGKTFLIDPLACGKRTDGVFFGYPGPSVSCPGYSERGDLMPEDGETLAFH